MHGGKGREEETGREVVQDFGDKRQEEQEEHRYKGKYDKGNYKNMNQRGKEMYQEEENDTETTIK